VEEPKNEPVKEEPVKEEPAKVQPSVVCGNCKNEIKSQGEACTIEQGAWIYNCESCGMRVRVRLMSVT
jgi:DNA-directed RNA polymerase subunit RPC12/RpoP